MQRELWPPKADGSGKKPKLSTVLARCAKAYHCSGCDEEVHGNDYHLHAECTNPEIAEVREEGYRMIEEVLSGIYAKARASGDRKAFAAKSRNRLISRGGPAILPRAVHPALRPLRGFAQTSPGPPSPGHAPQTGASCGRALLVNRQTRVLAAACLASRRPVGPVQASSPAIKKI